MCFGLVRIKMTLGKIHSVETMGALDGPGLRYVLFMKGCPFRCAYCHNPDTWASSKADEKSPREVADDILKYKEFFKASKGGFTASGGEPLLQPEFLAELLDILKSEKIHTAIDTCGYVDISPQIKRVVDLCDLFLLDIKHLDGREHEKLTGKPNDKVLNFLNFLSENKKEIHARIVLVNKITAEETYLKETAGFLKKFPAISRVDLLPYHTLGVKKWEALKILYRLDDSALLSPSQKETALDIFRRAGFDATIQ